jgi:HK97 family phage major capsid protein
MEFQAQLESSLASLGTQLDSKIKDANAQSEEKISKKFMGELKDLGEKFKETQDELTALAQKSFTSSASAKKETMGQSFVGSDSFKAFADGSQPRARFEYQGNTISGETASNPNDTLAPFERMSGIVGGPSRTLSILDFIPKGSTSSNAIDYTKETAFTNNSAETAEAAQKPESDLTFELANAPVRTIAHFIKVTKQVMDDAPMLSSYIDNRMGYGVRLRLEQQIINGNGTAPNISGILDGNSTAVVVGGSENTYDYTNKLKYAVIGSDFAPDFYFMNPADWSAMEVTKRGAADAAYVGAGGAISYVNGGLEPRLWGLPVVPSNSVPAGTVIAGSRDAMMLWTRQGVTIDVSESDADNFQKNLLTIRAEMRAAFTVFRNDALVTADLSTLPA